MYYKGPHIWKVGKENTIIYNHKQALSMALKTYNLYSFTSSSAYIYQFQPSHIKHSNAEVVAFGKDLLWDPQDASPTLGVNPD